MTSLILANALSTIDNLCASYGYDLPTAEHLGFVWVWDARAPTKGKWHTYRSALPDNPPRTPSLYENARQGVEILYDIFGGSEQALCDLGCDHTELLHTPIQQADDIDTWRDSIFHAVSPSLEGLRP